MRRPIFAALLVLALDPRAHAQTSFDPARLAQGRPFDSPRLAQGKRDGRLIVTVVDPSGAVIPGATVAITGLDDLTKEVPIVPTKTTDKGIAAIDSLLPGRYAIQAEFPGFEAGTLRDVRVRRGDNKQVVVLAIKRMEESIDVAQDAQAAAADPRGAAFKAVLTPEEVEALSDDPADLAQQLQDLAGGNAVIRVDSFLGAPLPPKAQIKAIHIVRDAFAAENHSAESDEIDIITAPGTGPIRVSGSSRFRDGSMSGRSPFTPTKGPERTQTYDGNIGGTIVKNKSSFSLAAGSRQSFDTPLLNVALPGGGRRSEVLGLRRPNDNWFVHGLVDYALTRNHQARLAYDQYSTDRSNLGIGAYDLSERAYSTESRSHELRVMEVGPIGRRAFANTRLQERQDDTARQCGDLLQLGQPWHVRADAARRRVPAAGAQHRQPTLSGSGCDWAGWRD
jgi:carboxypeptidase family protein